MFTAEQVIAEMMLNTNSSITTTEDQYEELQMLTKEPTVRALSLGDWDVFLEGEEDEQMEIADRSLALARLHSLLNEIFNEGIGESHD